MKQRVYSTSLYMKQRVYSTSLYIRTMTKKFTFIVQDIGNHEFIGG